jgi:hypothetical protein
VSVTGDSLSSIQCQDTRLRLESAPRLDMTVGRLHMAQAHLTVLQTTRQLPSIVIRQGVLELIISEAATLMLQLLEGEALHLSRIALPTRGVTETEIASEMHARLRLIEREKTIGQTGLAAIVTSVHPTEHPLQLETSELIHHERDQCLLSEHVETRESLYHL